MLPMDVQEIEIFTSIWWKIIDIHNIGPCCIDVMWHCHPVASSLAVMMSGLCIARGVMILAQDMSEHQL